MQQTDSRVPLDPQKHEQPDPFRPLFSLVHNPSVETLSGGRVGLMAENFSLTIVGSHVQITHFVIVFVMLIVPIKWSTRHG